MTHIEKSWTTQVGYQATVKIMSQGHRCGYVTLPEDHPCNGQHYCDLPIGVHGGLTYGEGATFGFDCAHYGDRPDHSLMSPQYLPVYSLWANLEGEVRSLEFCIEQCESMAEQFKELE